MVLYLNDEAVGVLRIDIDGSTAWLRRVAIREDMQRQGHGRRMLELAAEFAVDEGCTMLRSFVDAAAIGFYRKVGFEVVRPAGSAGGMLMEKAL
jgi:GNAT superfamily N-acetyltransferase